MFGKSDRELAFDLLLMGGWALYAGGFLKRLMTGGGLVELGQVTAVTVFAALFLLRRPAQRTGTTLGNPAGPGRNFSPGRGAASTRQPLLAGRDSSGRRPDRHGGGRHLPREELRDRSSQPPPADHRGTSS